MELLKKYEIMILLVDDFNDNQVKSWVFNYAKNLRKFNVSNISVISRGKQNIAYSIKDKIKGNYIQLNFSSIPRYIKILLQFLEQDSKVLRFLIIKKKNNLE